MNIIKERASSTGTPSVLIYEPDHGGHKFNYVKLLVRGFAERGCKITLASRRDSFESREYRTELASLETRFEKLVLPTPRTRDGSLRRNLANSLSLAKSQRRASADLAIIPYLDASLYSLGLISALGLRSFLFGKTWMEGILFSGEYAYSETQGTLRYAAKGKLLGRILRGPALDRVLVVDETAFSYFANRASIPRTKLALCPDPIDNHVALGKEDFRKKYGLPQDAIVLGVLGIIDERKGVARLIKAFEQYAPKGKECLALLGQHTQAIKSCLATSAHRNRIVSVDEVIPGEHFPSGVRACDAIAAVYLRHYASSSLVLHAAAAARPVLGPSSGWVGNTVKQYKLGMTCDPSNLADLVRGLRWAFNNPQCDKDLARQLYSRNTAERFVQIVTQDAHAN